MARSDSSGPPPRSKPVRVGLAGAGRFGRLHASVLAGLPGVQLAGLAEPDDLRLRETAERHGIEARYRDAIDLIGDDTLDAIVLATPDELHFQIHGALREQLGDFAACIREGRPASVANLESAVESIRIAEAIVESATTGSSIHPNSDTQSS